MAVITQPSQFQFLGLDSHPASRVAFGRPRTVPFPYLPRSKYRGPSGVAKGVHGMPVPPHPAPRDMVYYRSLGTHVAMLDPVRLKVPDTWLDMCRAPPPEIDISRGPDPSLGPPGPQPYQAQMGSRLFFPTLPYLTSPTDQTLALALAHALHLLLPSPACSYRVPFY